MSKPLPVPPSKRIAERGAVTIAAGVMCSDGILICADSEETIIDISKHERQKVRIFEERLVFTGAGSSDYIDMTFDKLRDAYLAVWPTTPADARVAAEGIVCEEVYEKHLHRFYDREARPSMKLIIGVRCGNGELALIGTSESATFLRDSYITVGVGDHLFNYWAKLFMIQHLTAEEVAYLALFIVREVKNNIPGCGGTTYSVTLRKHIDAPGEIAQYPEDAVLAGFPQSAVKLMGSCLNGDLSDAYIDEQINEFTTAVRRLHQFRKKRAQLMMQHSASLSPQRSTP